ncbi:APC family permease [Aquipuribacter hungaricus]|uniref:APC family permease n=1 Tax=Aquipuribacter hungaricus TaxID=545624 RepID=A0ABV7WAL6_9MICO
MRRVLGYRLLLVLIVGDILGAGIYTLSGVVAGEIGGALWLPFLVAFVLAALTACSYAELVGRYPQAAGAALYVQQAVKIPLLTFMVAFAVVLSGITSAATASRAIGGDYLEEFVTLPVALVAAVFLLVVLAVNLWGVKQSLTINLVLTGVEVVGLLTVLGLGGTAVLTGVGDLGRLGEIDADGLFAIFGATALAFYALIGFEDSVNLAEETREPRKVFPKALFTGLGLTGVVYLLIAVISSTLVAAEDLAQSDGPLLLVVEAAGFDYPSQLFALISLVAVSNTALINLIMASRLLYGMGRQRVIPGVFARVLPGRRTPWVGAAVATAATYVLVLTGELDGLADTTVLFLLLVFTSVNVSCLVSRRDRVPGQGFRAPTAVPVLGAVASAFFASPFADRDADVYVRAGILLLVGLALAGVARLLRGDTAVLDVAELSADAEGDEAGVGSADTRGSRPRA